MKLQVSVCSRLALRHKPEGGAQHFRNAHMGCWSSWLAPVAGNNLSPTCQGACFEAMRRMRTKGSPGAGVAGAVVVVAPSAAAVAAVSPEMTKKYESKGQRSVRLRVSEEEYETLFQLQEEATSAGTYDVAIAGVSGAHDRADISGRWPLVVRLRLEICGCLLQILALTLPKSARVCAYHRSNLASDLQLLQLRRPRLLRPRGAHLLTVNPACAHALCQRGGQAPKHAAAVSTRMDAALLGKHQKNKPPATFAIRDSFPKPWAIAC